MVSLFRKTCLKPMYTLRVQLLLSFGVPTLLTIALVVSLAISFAHIAGKEVRVRANDVLEDQVIGSFARSSDLIAERVAAYMDNANGALQLMVEITRDRIVGYPEVGWEDDIYVPFFDTDTQRNMYPLKTPIPPLDWDITLDSDTMGDVYAPSVNYENVNKFFQDASVTGGGGISTSSGVYHFQGSCDPNEDDPTARGYAPNCTLAHNNLRTGGAVQPTNLSFFLQQKSGDIATLIRPIYEAQEDVMIAAIHFINSGAGATLWYPGHRVASGSYTSRGCEWMRQTNPYAGKPYGTEQDIDRCHPEGTIVSTREYNALERAWFHDCIENHEEFRWHGPFPAFDSGVELLTICRAIYDRKTQHLIGVAVIGVSAADFIETLQASRLRGNMSEIALVRYEDDSVFVDTSLNNERTAHIVYETGFISPENYRALRNLMNVGRDDEASHKTLRERTVLTCDMGIYTAAPLPPPPKDHDTSYIPDFILVHYIPNDIFSSVQQMNNKISEDLLRVDVLSTVVGVIGIVIVFVIVYFVSKMLTQPLLWIEKVVRSIVEPQPQEQAIDVLERADDEKLSAALRCAPRTEISQLVFEFRSLITGFSGKGASTVADSPVVELRNEMTWRSDFQQLYTCSTKRKKSFRLGSEAEETLSEPSSGNRNRVRRQEAREKVSEHSNVCVVPAPPKKNLGGIIIRDSKELHKKSALQRELGRVVAHRSLLFWWILVLIAIPSIVTNSLICLIVSKKIANTVPDWVDVVEDASIEIEKGALELAGYLKAKVAETMVQEIVRDLHFGTRVAGWLLFGGIKRSDAFVDMIETTEDCKIYPGHSCPFFESDQAACACEWQDIQVAQCTWFNNETKARSLQRRFWMIPARDPGFPEYDTTANDTLWWNTTDDLPGSFKGKNASGFGTSYDRIRVSSAMAVVDTVLYNTGRHLRTPKQDLGSFLAFDDDGALTGYGGCVHSQASLSQWHSTTENYAAEIAPHVCPIGKYGYDPRCRDWYATGKNRYLSDGLSLHVTPPYNFVSDGASIGTSATSPIVNPTTGKYLGQTLLDFAPTRIREALSNLEDPMTAFLITPEYDRSRGDTVVGPGKSSSEWKSADILDLLFQNESSTSSNREGFEDTLQAMKLGLSGVTEYARQAEGEPERLSVLAYRPVYARTYQALSPDDFARGVNVSRSLVYTVAISAWDEKLRRPFLDIEEEVFDNLEHLRTLYIALVAVISALLAMYACLITSSMTRPLIILYRVVQQINSGMVDHELPPLSGGSREVNLCHAQFAKLIKVVRISNIAYYSGALQRSLEFISDALALFRRVNDEKAIGIACNNLGNTLFAMAKEADSEDLSIFQTGMAHYNESIAISQRNFVTATDEIDKSDYAQQLADRLFNRSIFSLLAHSLGSASDVIRDSALEDLRHVRELDYDTKDYWIDRKLLLKNSDKCFSRLLRRIHGLVDFYDDEQVIELWDPKELINEADNLLFAAWNQPSAGLFEKFTPVGRLQQLEDAAMRLDLLVGKKANAARLAMRILVEDEFVLESVFATAAKSLVEFLHDEASASWSSKTKLSCRQDLRRMALHCKNRSVDLSKNVLFALEINECFECDPILEKIRENCFGLYTNYCSSDDHVGVVAYTVDGDLNVELGSKEENESRQRYGLDLATTSTGDCVSPTLHYATQMVIDCPCSENDTYIILISDGYSWDPASFAAARKQIEQLNKDRGSTIHLLILGLEVEESEAVENYMAICSFTKLSWYADISMENIDMTFRTVGDIISGRSLTATRSQCLTMERF